MRVMRRSKGVGVVDEAAIGEVEEADFGKGVGAFVGGGAGGVVAAGLLPDGAFSRPLGGVQADRPLGPAQVVSEVPVARRDLLQNLPDHSRKLHREVVNLQLLEGKLVVTHRFRALNADYRREGRFTRKRGMPMAGWDGCDRAEARVEIPQSQSQSVVPVGKAKACP